MRTAPIHVAGRSLELRAAQFGVELTWIFAIFENGRKLADIAELSSETAADMEATGYTADAVQHLMDVLCSGIEARSSN